MEPIVQAFSMALVAAMATDTWKQALEAAGALWRRVRGRRGSDDFKTDLESMRERVLAARQGGKAETGQAEQAVAVVLQGRLQELLFSDPSLAREMRRILDEILGPMLMQADRTRIDKIFMVGSSHDSSTFNQIANQTIIQQPSQSLPEAMKWTLPADTATFTGREREIRKITAVATAQSAQSSGPSICVIEGMPGVGKSSLAVHIGHLLANEFPDRQLFIDLQAHTFGVKPADTGDILASLLISDGVDPRNVPRTLDFRGAMWRDRMAFKRMLLILDNAAGSDQVQPLIPGTPGCLILITSRRHLGDLSRATTEVSMDVMPDTDASQLFSALAPRSVGEPAKVAELVDLCGRLPLAIKLLAGVFNKHPAWGMNDLIDATSAKLLTATAENHTVSAALDLSYQYLTPDQQRFFRLLGLHIGTNIDVYAAAALSDISVHGADDHLEELLGEHLLTEHIPHRYGMHDLVRRYAYRLANADSAADRGQAVARLLGYYLQAAQIANQKLGTQSRPPTAGRVLTTAAVPKLDDRRGALQWMRAERTNLLACADYSAAHQQYALTVAFSAAMAAWLRIDGLWTEAVTVHTAAVKAALALDDRLGQANALYALGVRSLTGDLAGADEALGQALGIYNDIADRHGEANALIDLGILRRLAGRYDDSTTLLSQALDIYIDLDNQPGQAAALKYIGITKRVTDDYSGAETFLNRALYIYREFRDQQGQATTLDNLGMLRYLSGDFPAATALLEQALISFKEIGDRLGEANCLNNLGTVRRLSGDLRDAAAIIGDALDTLRHLGNRLGEANCLNNLGVTHKLRGDLSSAESTLQQALDIYVSLKHPLGRANALIDLGAVRGLRGDLPGAATMIERGLNICRKPKTKDRLGEASALAELGTVWRQAQKGQEAAHVLDQAFRIYSELNDRLGCVEVLNRKGALYLSTDDVREAHADYELALQQSRAIVSQLEEARALEGLGRCDQSQGNEDAMKKLRQALHIYQRIGAAEAQALRAEIHSSPPRTDS